MKILLIVDPGIKVPPSGYGGIERVVALLAEQYISLGHEVDLFASEGSTVQGCKIIRIGKAGFPPTISTKFLALFTAWTVIWSKRNQYDLIHSFWPLLYLLPVINKPVKKIMCYQREITTRNIFFFDLIPNKNMIYTACSINLMDRAKPPGKWFAIYNAVNFSKYTLTTHLPANAPLIFLGRIERIKGCHNAIKIALKTNQELIIAGNISNLSQEIDYFKEEILPFVDGKQIKYVGELNDKEKNEWLGKAKALLMPIEWNEPFGIVMIEAMACGTPVLGFDRGSAPEIIDDGITGYSFSSLDEIIRYIPRIHEIDRKACREKAKTRFDISVITIQYLKLHVA